MSDTLTVSVNRRKHTVQNDIETLDEFLSQVGYAVDTEHRDPSDEYEVYRTNECPNCGSGDEVEITGPMFVFDDGDKFTVIPRYINGG